MTAAAHVYEIFIRAPRERVWEALVDPDQTVEYFHRTRIQSSFEPGAKYRYVLAADDRDAVEGEIEVCEPPQRLVMTWRVLYDAAMSEEPPGRVEWTLTPVGDGEVTRVTLRHGDLALSPLTWEHVRLGWVGVVDSLKSFLETGTALPPLDLDAGSDPAEIEGDWHRAQGAVANNSAWECLEQTDRSPDEVDELLHRAYAAAYHWNRATGTTDVNRARASWLISRAHAPGPRGRSRGRSRPPRRRRPPPSEPTGRHDAGRADRRPTRRALACLGRLDEARAERELAVATAVADEQDREIYESDLAAGPWFDL